MFKTYVYWTLACAGLALLLAAVWPRQAQTAEERAALAEGRTIITYWDRHTGHEFEARKALIDEFNQTVGQEKRIFVRTVVIGSRIEKLLTAIAGGAPPDICSMGTSVLAQLAHQGCFMPLGEEMAKSPYLRESAFFPHAWKLVHFDGHTWGIPTTTDTMCLLWNKSAFRRAGLDPEVPPKTVRELEEFAAKLTIRKGNVVEQYGFIPWQPWNQTFLWGEMFGGKWYDETTGLMACGSDPAIIQSLAWQQRFAINPGTMEGRAAAGPPINEPFPFAADPGLTSQGRLGGAYQSANNPFYSGKVAMITEGEWQCTFIPKYAPDLDWGVAPIPQPEGAPPRCFAPECVADAVPSGSRHPKEAWVFLHWFYAPRPDGRPSPASDYNLAIHNIPPRRDEAVQERFTANPKFAVFINELLTKPGILFPSNPAAQFISDTIEQQTERVTFRRTTPEAAAKAIEELSNTEIRAAWKLSGKGRS